ncbi:MAG: hypothetical protein Q9212_002667 [Teloschistes hypoglaucus]
MQGHFTKFLELPQELRLIIYEYAISPEYKPKSIQWKARPGDLPIGGEAKNRRTLHLLLANKQIHSEASTIVFGERFLSFDLNGNNHTYAAKGNWAGFQYQDPFVGLSKRLNGLCQDSFLSKVRNVRITVRQMTNEDTQGTSVSDQMRYSYLSQDLTLICHTLNSQGCRVKNVVIEAVCKCPLRCVLQLPLETPHSKASYKKAKQCTYGVRDWPAILEEFEAEERCFDCSQFKNIISHLDLLRVSGSVKLITSCTKPTAKELYPVFNNLAAVLKSKTPPRKLNAFEKEYLELRSRIVPHLKAVPYLDGQEPILTNIDNAWFDWYSISDYQRKSMEGQV